MAVAVYAGVYGHENVGSVEDGKIYNKAGETVATVENDQIVDLDGSILGRVEGLKAFNADGECVGHSEGDKICRGEKGFDCIGHYDGVDDVLAVAAYCLLLEPEVRLY